MYVDFNFFMKIKMKKTFWIMWTWLLLASNVLMSFSNVSFAVNCGEYSYLEPKWCYAFEHHYSNCDGSYRWSGLKAYKCDEKWWELDLRKAPLDDGQYIAYIWEDAFSWTNVTKVIIPSTVMGIWDGAFCNVEREWNPTCGDGIIDKELWEECDDGNEIFMFWVDDSYMCDNECKIVPVPVCGNSIWEQWENCNNCKVDVEADGWNCTKSVWDEIDVKYLDESQDLEYKWEYRETSASISPVNNANFVEVDFPEWMNNEFLIEGLDYACAKLQEYTINFETEDGDNLGTIETEYQHINSDDIPQVPEKEWLIWAWYLSGEIFDFNSQITGNITLVYKYEKWWIEYDEENWWIKVSLWDQEIIIKDKNQGAEKSVNEVDTGNSSDLINAVWTYYLWWNNTWLDSSEIFDDNGQILDVVDLPEWFDHGYLWMQWWDDWTAWSDDTPCNVDSWEYLPSPDEWKNLMQIWWKINWYELIYVFWRYNFNDYTWSPKFHERPQLIDEYPESTFHRAYDSEVGGESTPGNISMAGGTLSSIKKFMNDLYVQSFPPLFVENWKIDISDFPIIYPTSLSNWKVWYLSTEWLFLSDKSNLEWFENNIATPVRCFIKPQFDVSFEVNGWTDVVTQKIFSWDKAVEPEVQKENAEFLWWFTEDWTIFKFDTPITSDIKLHAEWQEKKTNNGYSGWWGGGASSTAKTSDKSHNSADDKVDSTSKEKTDSTSKEKVETTSDEKTDKNQQNNMDENKKQDKNTEPVVPNKVTYVPDRSLSENEQAYDFAHTYWITTKTSVESAEMDKPLTRIQMSKMLSQYAMNVMWRQPDVSEWTVKFRDVTNDMDKSYDNWVTLSYQLWIMWQNMPNHKFRPNDIVTRAEFITALSRLLYSTSDGEYRSTSKYYVHHMEKLKNEWIITNDNPNMTEKRWYVMLMLLRSVK